MAIGPVLYLLFKPVPSHGRGAVWQSKYYSGGLSVRTVTAVCPISTECADNGVNILKSIDEGPFKMGTFRETLAEGTEGALHLGPERDRVFTDLTPEEKKRFKVDIHATNILLQGLPKDIYTLINHYTDAKDIWDNVKMLLEGAVAAGNGGVQNKVGNANPGQARQIKCYNCNGTWHIARNCTQPKQL
ncbi:integrase, catalytic region, zinc finger, CCHC-type containing protein [Tanacetum coccineum]